MLTDACNREQTGLIYIVVVVLPVVNVAGALFAGIATNRVTVENANAQ